MIPIHSIDLYGDDYFEPLRSNRGPWASFDVREECLPKGDYQIRAHCVPAEGARRRFVEEWNPEHCQKAESVSYDSLDREQRTDAYTEHRFVRQDSACKSIAARQLSTCFISRGSLSKVHLVAPAQRPNAGTKSNRGDPLPCSNTRTHSNALLAC